MGDGWLKIVYLKLKVLASNNTENVPLFENVLVVNVLFTHVLPPPPHHHLRIQGCPDHCGWYTQPHCECAVPHACDTSLAHSKLIFCEHTTNHSWCELAANIIFNTEIRCAVRKLKFQCKNMSTLCTIFLLCSCKNRQNFICHVQLQQQRSTCLQSHQKRHTF